MGTFSKIVGSLMLLFFVGQAWSKSAAPCLDYEPSFATLTGVLVRRTYPGPPNFESIREGDKPETSWVLMLPRPVCVDGRSGDPVNVAMTNIRRVQLVFENQESYETYRRILRRRAVVTGLLFGAITAHHHTDVLLIVTTIGPVQTHFVRIRPRLSIRAFSHIHTQGAENARKAAAYIAEHGPTNNATEYIVTHGEEPTPDQVRRLGNVHFVQRVGNVFLYEPGPAPQPQNQPKQ